jgi:hypothetical protein
MNTTGGPPVSDADNVQVDVHDLASYGMTVMTKLPLHFASATASLLGPISTMTMEAFEHFTDLGAFEPGMRVAEAIHNDLAAFQAFFADVGQGLAAIGNAAWVIAENYQATDLDAAHSLDAVGFAFGDLSKRPAGLASTPTTIQQENAANRAAAGGLCQAALGAPDTVAQVYHHDSSGHDTVVYGDGSRVDTFTDAAGNHFTVISDPSGKQVRRTTTTESATTTTTVREGAPGTGNTKTVVTHDGAGNPTTVQITTDDGHGTVQTGAPVTIDSGAHAPSKDVGPTQRTQTDLHSFGDKNSRQRWGHGY